MTSRNNSDDNPRKLKSGRPHILTSPGDQKVPQRAGEALGYPESFLSSIIDQSPYPMWIADDQGTLIWLNLACRDLLHLTGAEVVGKYNVFQDNIVEQQGFLPLLRRVFEKGETARFELTYDTSLLKTLPLKTATSVILDVTVSPIMNGSGKITNAVFQHVDITDRKRAETALAESEQRFKIFMDHLPAAVFIKDQESRLLFANRYLREIFGWENCLGKTTEELVPPELTASMLADDRRALAAGPLVIQEKVTDGQGVEYFFDTYKFPVKADGAPVLLGGIAVDVTERKRAAEALKKEKLFTEAILDSLPGTFFLLDSQGKHLRANTSGLVALGYSFAEISNMHALDFIAEEDKPAAQRALEEVIAKGTASVEAQHLAKDGRKTPFLFTAKKFIIDDLPYILGTGLNITARKEAEEALRESEERYRSLFQNNHSVMLLIDPETGAVMDANHAACAYYGFSKEELLAKKITDINTLTPEQVFQEMQRAKAEERKRFEFRHRLAGGEVRDVVVFSGPIRIKGQELLYSIVHDVTARKEAEKALRVSQEYLKTVMESVGAGIVVVDAETRQIVDINPFAEKIISIPREEIIDKICHEHICPAEIGKCPVMDLGLTVDQSERLLLTGCGQTIPILKTVTHFQKEGRKYLLETFLDITERKRMEEALRESEGRFRQVVESSPLPIGIGNDSGMIEYVNPKFMETFGYTLEDLPRLEDWFRLAYPDPAYRQSLVSWWQKAWERITQNGTAEVVEAEITCKDDSKRIMEIFGTLMGNKSLVVFNDLTERKRAEVALRDSERRLSEIIDFLPDATFVIDLTGKVIAWNRAIEEMTGVKAESMIGKGNYEYALPFYGIRRPILIDLVFMTDAEIEKEYSFIKREGDILLAEAHVPIKGEMYLLWGKARPLYDSEGKIVGAIETIRDISVRQRAEEERARLEAQMREVQKLESLGVLAGGIAHDFNNLLMAILGNADLALLAMSIASPARPHVEEITRGSLRAADLCRQMLAYSGKGRFVISRYDLAEIVQEMAQMLRVSVSKKASLRYSFAADLPAVEVDATQMRQVIMNLIINASEALEDQNGFISVASGVMDCDRAFLAESYLDDKLPEGRYVYLEVADTGCGMNDDTRQRIFDPFFTTKFTGRGLGLAAVLGIVRGHQGAIKVYSEPGQGTTFKVLLPAVDWAPGERAVNAAPKSPPLPGGTILLVDDDPQVRQVASQMLERLGFKVLTAAHGREGLEVFKAGRGEIDCVILDLTMPEMAGEEVFRKLRRLRKDVRVILSSGFNEQDVTQRFAGKGVAGFIQKPYTMRMLRETLNRVLGPK